MRITASVSVVLMLVLLVTDVRADLLSAINAERAQGCNGRPGVAAPLRANRKLDEAARRLRGGRRLQEALAQAKYASTKSTSIRIGAGQNEQAVIGTLRRQFCNSLTDAQLQELGSYRRGGDLWLVLAQPFPASLRDAQAVSERVLVLVNEARSRARRCGKQRFEPTGPLRQSPALQKAALAHARDMAAENFFDHRGSDGSTPAERITRQGYKWRTVGENLAASITTADEAVQGWLDSPPHCANLMDPRFTETGLAYSVNVKSKLRIYWSQVFATPP